MLKVAITGNIASGKSEVEKMLLNKTDEEIEANRL